MKKYLVYIVTIITLTALSGCDNHSVNNAANTSETVEVGGSVLVYPGDTVIPLSENTKVDVNNIYDDGYSTVTVLAGSVEVTRG